MQRKIACGSREDFIKPDICQQISEAFFGYKKSACGSRADLTMPDMCQQNIRNTFWLNKKAPTAARKTVSSLIHVTKPIFPRISNYVGLYVLRIRIRMALVKKLIKIRI